MRFALAVLAALCCERAAAQTSSPLRYEEAWATWVVREGGKPKGKVLELCWPAGSGAGLECDAMNPTACRNDLRQKNGHECVLYRQDIGPGRPQVRINHEQASGNCYAVPARPLPMCGSNEARTMRSPRCIE